MNDALIAMTTAGSEEEARRIAQDLVERRLAACVNILPNVESIYRWRGKVERAQEWLMIIKTTRTSYPALEQAIVGLHSYEVPEVVALEVKVGADAYLGWIRESVLAPLDTDT